MGITSYVFVLVYFPLMLLGWSGSNKLKKYKLADIILILASIIFIGSYDFRFVCTMLATVCVNYMFAKYINIIKNVGIRKIVVALGIIANLGVLFCLKYCNWIRTLIDSNALLWKLFVPIGISFYTLEQICFLVDSYKNGEMNYTFAEYILFSTYFPVVVSGPIIRHDNFIMQVREKDCRSVSHERISEGLISFCLGMGKKVIVASYLGKIAAMGYDDVGSVGCLTMILSVVAYTLQLYFDFSGYCDIVEGISLMLGFVLPANFNSPYKALSIGEFWKRWHITLTSFLTHYVYIPLGGNRRGKIRQYFNIFIVFLVSGFWHGASLTYILWGMMHGICMVIDKIIFRIWSKIPKFVGRCMTFSMVALMWVPFRTQTIYDAYAVYWTLVFGDRTIVKEFGTNTFPMIAYLCENYLGISGNVVVRMQNCLTILIMLSLIMSIFFMKNVREIRKVMRKSIGGAIICGIILFMALLQFQEVGTFIYEGF